MFSASTTITYFLCLVFIKQFDKLEKNQAEKLKALQDSVQYDPETDAAGNISLAAGKKDIKELEKGLDTPDAEEDKSGNKVTRFIRTEKKKLKDLPEAEGSISCTVLSSRNSSGNPFHRSDRLVWIRYIQR